MPEQADLIVFYDGRCPLCVKEIRLLKRYNHRGRLQLEDIHASDFTQRFPQVDPAKAVKILHGLNAEGKWLTGLDVTAKAWQLVNRHRWLAVLRWPLIRPLADLAYRFFARHRQTLAWLITGQQHCERCVTDDDSSALL